VAIQPALGVLNKAVSVHSALVVRGTYGFVGSKTRATLKNPLFCFWGCQTPMPSQPRNGRPVGQQYRGESGHLRLKPGTPDGKIKAPFAIPASHEGGRTEGGSLRKNAKSPSLPRRQPIGVPADRPASARCQFPAARWGRLKRRDKGCDHIISRVAEIG